MYIFTHLGDTAFGMVRLFTPISSGVMLYVEFVRDVSLVCGSTVRLKHPETDEEVVTVISLLEKDYEVSFSEYSFIKGEKGNIEVQYTDNIRHFQLLRASVININK